MASITKGSMRAYSIKLMVVAIVTFCFLAPCMAQFCKGKQSWPELVGVDGKIAKQIIESQNPLVHAVIVDKSTRLIENFRCDRVWIFVSNDDGTGTVTKVPTVG